MLTGVQEIKLWDDWRGMNKDQGRWGCLMIIPKPGLLGICMSNNHFKVTLDIPPSLLPSGDILNIKDKLINKLSDFIYSLFL